MALINQDVTAVEAVDNFTPLPDGDYPIMVVESDTGGKSGQTTYLKLVFEICEGHGKGRKLFHYINLWHPASNVQEIAKGELKQICTAIGHPGNVQDSAELHGVPLTARVRVKPAEMALDPSTGQQVEKFPAGNDIKGFKAYAPPTVAAPVAAPAPAMAAPAPAPAAAPGMAPAAPAVAPAPVAAAPAPAPGAAPAMPGWAGQPAA